MRNAKSLLFAALAVCFTLVIFFACQKKESTLQQPETTIAQYKAAVDDWYQTEIKLTTEK